MISIAGSVASFVLSNVYLAAQLVVLPAALIWLYGRSRDVYQRLRSTVILTMRSDFESYVARIPSFQPLFEQAQAHMTPLSASELREAIEKPAEVAGLRFEAGIIEALLQDILGEPAALPLLQFTLLKLWDNRQRNRVTWDAYRRVGSGRGAPPSFGPGWWPPAYSC